MSERDWLWMMDYCKDKGLAPSNNEHWEIAKKALGEMMSKEKYEKHLSDFISEGGKDEFARAAAMTRLIEECIKSKDYQVFDWLQNSDPDKPNRGYDPYAVYVMFKGAGDPLFGFVGENDGDTVFLYPTAKGVMYYEL